MTNHSKDPAVHSHIEDVLDCCHHLAFVTVNCDGDGCTKQLHAFNNECMQTWVETGKGNFCIKCFSMIPDVGTLSQEYAIE